MLEQGSTAMPQAMEMATQHQQTQQPAVRRLLLAPDLVSTLHCAGPRSGTHQGPLVP